MGCELPGPSGRLCNPLGMFKCLGTTITASPSGHLTPQFLVPLKLTSGSQIPAEFENHLCRHFPPCH